MKQEFCIALVAALQEAINEKSFLCNKIKPEFKKELQDNLRDHFSYDWGNYFAPILEIALGRNGSIRAHKYLSENEIQVLSENLRNNFVRDTLIKYGFTPAFNSFGFVMSFYKSEEML
jgi:hypothetical protein